MKARGERREARGERREKRGEGRESVVNQRKQGALDIALDNPAKLRQKPEKFAYLQHPHICRQNLILQVLGIEKIGRKLANFSNQGLQKGGKSDQAQRV